MSFRKTSLVVLSVILLAGCKTTVETEVSVSDLLTSGTKTIPGNLYVEVAACNDHEDSRKPSSTLIKTQEIVPTVFPEAKYEECYRQKFDSFARFIVPIVLDKDQDGKLASENHVNIVSNKDNLLSVAVPEVIKSNLDKAKHQGPGTAFKMNVSIKVNNDSGQDFPFTVMASYVDDQPQVFSNLTAPAGSSFVVRLSDVSVSSALDNGSTRVLIHAIQ